MSLPGLSPTAAAPPFDVNNTIGALLIGGLLATALWGITCSQVFVFFQYKGDDPLRTKILVVFLWCLDTFNTALNFHILYHYLVSNFLNPIAIASPVWSLVLHVTITTVTDCLIRLLFARRVYQLSRGNIIVTAAIVAITIVDLTCGLVITVKAFKITFFTQLSGLSTLFYLNFAAGFSGDLCVAVALCFYLYKSRTGFQRTDNMISVLIGYTINTGLLTTINALLGLVFYIAMPTNYDFIAAYLLLPELYLNSYIATLNAREYLREKTDGVVSIHLSHISPSSRGYNTGIDSQPSAAQKHEQRSNELAISVETVVNSKTDEYVEYEKKRRPKTQSSV